MACPFAKASEPIADIVVDKTTSLYPRHTVYTHLGCICLRTVLGLVLLNSELDHKNKTRSIVLFLVILLMFGCKYLSFLAHNTVVWKAYPRTLMAYASALYLIHKNQSRSAGMLVLVDGLMGLQSRHMAHVASVIAKC
jgi:hypothetical protein